MPSGTRKLHISPSVSSPAVVCQSRSLRLRAPNRGRRCRGCRRRGGRAPCGECRSQGLEPIGDAGCLPAPERRCFRLGVMSRVARLGRLLRWVTGRVVPRGGACELVAEHRPGRRVCRTGGLGWPRLPLAPAPDARRTPSTPGACRGLHRGTAPRGVALRGGRSPHRDRPVRPSRDRCLGCTFLARAGHGWAPTLPQQSHRRHERCAPCLPAFRGRRHRRLASGAGGV
jgi:hypothetical protein